MTAYDNFDDNKRFACRVIADHARATAFSIADGILPGNEGRNYVLRKIMRRAIYHGRNTLGIKGAFFNEVTNFVVDEMREAYPELEAQRDFIRQMVSLEEERFGSTLTVGLQKMDQLFAQATAGQVPEFKELAKLYDTFGTPRDLIRVGLEERGFELAEDEFNSSFDAALQELQLAGAGHERQAQARSKPVYAQVAERVGRNAFTGYDETTSDDVNIIALIKGDGEVLSLSHGEEGEVVLASTPFYAESGGQVGDTGILVGAPIENSPPATAGGTDFVATVVDTISPVSGLIVHRVKVERGSVKIGDKVTAQVDVEKRDATRRNHTATHLMHAALREVLGTHVKQAGSIVAPNYLRFDFMHYQPLTRDEIAEVERLVNFHILRNEPVQTDLMAIENAMRTGAMALFGEKYGEQVRVLSIKGAEDIFSRELCGGTHVRATGDIGSFKITSDESIASGTRRIRAVTGADAFARFQESDTLLDQLAGGLRTSRAELPGLVVKLQDELKKARRDADELRLKIATGAVGDGSNNGDEVREVAGIKVLAREAGDVDSNAMRQMSDTLLSRLKSGVVVIGRAGEGKVSLIVRTSDDLAKRVPAGKVIQALAPIVGGKGGGRSDMAEGGGNLPEKLTEALDASYGVIEKLLAAT
ncbi:MAG: alanine--tRNA ligase [Pyrinomonadaceae bacterium]